MKKLVALCFAVILLLSCSLPSLADNSLEFYNARLKGTWNCISYSSVSKNNYPAFWYMYSFGSKNLQYPEGGKDYSLTLVGDGSDETYLVCNYTDSTFGTISAGQVFLSLDNSFMLILMPDGGQFFYVKTKKLHMKRSCLCYEIAPFPITPVSF